MAFISAPSNLIAVFAMVALVLVVFRRRHASIALFLSLALIVVVGLSPLGNILLWPLEERYAQWEYPSEPIEGIIVLGGSYDGVRHAYLSPILVQPNGEALPVIVALARKYHDAKIILAADRTEQGGAEASMMVNAFSSFGIPADRMLSEPQAPTLSEKANSIASMLKPSSSSRWLLLGYGYQMPRAVELFQKAGFRVHAIPVRLRAYGWNHLWTTEGTATDNLRAVDVATREWVSLFLDRLRLWLDQTFQVW